MSSPAPRARRLVPVVATAVAAALVVAGGSTLAAGSAGAADKPLSQSVGRFLDGAVGGNPIQQLADLKDARAVNPGTTSAQNPLDATLLGSIEVPLGDALKLPGGGVFTLGAANQVAVAKSDGYSYGASGAVSNSGGISLGGSSDFPADATIDLSAAALGSVPIPGVPGVPDTTAAALGGVSATIGAVSGLAQTKTGGDPVTPSYQIASLKLTLGSPALGALLGQLAQGSTALNGLLGPLQTALSALSSAIPGLSDVLSACNITSGSLPSKLTLDGGAVVIDPAKATITIDLDLLLKQLLSGQGLNDLPANTDLLAYVLNNLGTILSTGLEAVINGIINPIKALGSACLSAITSNNAVGSALGALVGQLTSGQSALEAAVNKIAAELADAGAPGLKALTDNLAKVVAIGVNVESGAGKAADNTKYKFTSALKATPNQNTAVVPDQTLVRAIEIDLLGPTGAVLALGNAAAGPSTPAVPVTSPTPTTTPPGTAVPTGVPAGMAQPSGTPTLPIVLLVLGVLMAGGAAVSWRLRGGRHLG